MALSEIVTTTIQAGTVNASRRGFGTPLILCYHTAWAGDEVRTYTSFSGVAADFSANEPAYLMAQKMFQQGPRPSSIKIGRLPTPGTGQVTRIDATDYDIVGQPNIQGTVTSPDGTTTAIDVAWSTDLPTTLGLLDTALDAITGLTAATSSPVVTATADNPGESFYFEFTTDGVDVYDQTLTWGYDTRLTNILDVDPDFYCVVIENNSPDNMAEVAAWVSSNDRIAGFGPQFTKPSLFGSGLFTTGADHTALMANDDAFALFTAEPRSTYKECAWAAARLPYDPGSVTWAYTQLASTGADSYTATERTTIEGTNVQGNHYVAEANVGITRPGKMFGGEWIDVVRGLDWLEARLQERLFTLLVNEPKVPYTEAGLGQLVAEVRGQLREAEDRSVIDSGWTVTVLSVADQAPADRTNRIVRGLEFQARLAGAVHTINIIGTVTV